MIELKCPIHEDMVQPLEDHFCELTRSSWMLFHEGPGKPHFVMGYFDTKPEADEAWAGLRKAFKKLPEAGCTVHWVNAEIDGGAHLGQTRVTREAADTLQSFSHKIHAAEHALLPAVIARLSETLS